MRLMDGGIDGIPKFNEDEESVWNIEDKLLNDVIRDLNHAFLGLEYVRIKKNLII